MKFTQVHTEYMSEMEAHGNCMFIYWHRMMLLGYENMLRSLDPKYRCVTLPYWDHLSNSAQSITGSCKNFADCAPVIGETGGNAGVSKSLVVYNVTITLVNNTCVNREPLSHFCGNNTQCAGCVTRRTATRLAAYQYPPSATFGSVANQFATSNFTNFFTNIERGVHNIIHSTLGGTMAYLTVDAKDLGNYSYTYTISGGMDTCYKYCGSSTSLTAANTSTSLLADQNETRARGERLRPITKPGTAGDDTVKRWSIALFESARIVGYSESAAREQMEMALCQYQQDCLGGVPDYTALFRANFGFEGHPRCFTLMQYLKSGDRVIGIPHWKEITSRFLPCAAYKTRAKTALEKAVGKYSSTRS
ncbi:RxLR-like protein [Phytophthora cinnamomi]|uniref:RxLR-like protein n=1 Tax=Phytophthora cinnamomi TaxID=4785 RepID=UPI00355A78D8|nr:RxLR-like protein [Phytophthora cinnamomi]